VRADDRTSHEARERLSLFVSGLESVEFRQAQLLWAKSIAYDQYDIAGLFVMSWVSESCV
jgi:hypothetical protein